MHKFGWAPSRVRFGQRADRRVGLGQRKGVTMNVDVVAELLHKHPFVEDLDQHHIEKLAEMASEVDYERDQVIFREGDECNLFYLILSGKVALEIAAPPRTIRVQTLNGGDEMGWSSVLMQERLFQARALEPVRLLAFDGVRLHEVCKQDSSFGYELMYRFLRVVSRRLQATRFQLLDMYAPAAKLSRV